MPMTFVRRTNYDECDFRCTCRVKDDPVTDTIKMPDGTIKTRIRFNAVTNPSPFSGRKQVNFIAEARGARAERLSAFIFKGVGLYIHGELDEITEKTYDKSLRHKMTERYNLIVIEHCHVVSVPDTKSKSETYTDLFVNIDEEEY